jgi:hypothetical protein
VMVPPRYRHRTLLACQNGEQGDGDQRYLRRTPLACQTGEQGMVPRDIATGRRRRVGSGNRAMVTRSGPLLRPPAKGAPRSAHTSSMFRGRPQPVSELASPQGPSGAEMRTVVLATSTPTAGATRAGAESC